MNPSQFINNLQALSFVNTFNPYTDFCEKYDKKNAPNLRSEILFEILQIAAHQEIDSLWIGRDLGYRGGRRTGLALTDDANIYNHSKRWGKSFSRTTIGEPTKERTAAVIWSILDKISETTFLWNVFPLHPHKVSDPFSNRQHSVIERKAGEIILIQLIELISPKRIIAIGNDADHVIKNICADIDIHKVRHPSYGGQNVFLDQISKIYNLEQSHQLQLFNS